MRARSMQLDIFAHSRNVTLRNAACEVLASADVAAALVAVSRLRSEYPDDAMLADLQALTDAYGRRAQPPCATHDDLRAAIAELELHTTPAARHLYTGNAATRILQPLWRDLAARAAALPLRRDRPDDHAVPLLLRANDWQTAADAIERLEAWRHIPVTLAWMCEASYRLIGLDAIWPLLAQLAWLAPARLVRLIAILDDPLLTALKQRFDADFDGDGSDDDAWLPAWLLVHKPGLLQLLAAAAPVNHTPPERALRAMVRLLVLERAGRQREVVQARAELKALHGGLFAAYMRAR